MSGPAYSTGQILLSQNEDWQVSIQYLTIAGGPPGVPIDISGSQLRLQIRTIEEQRTALVDVETPDGITINDGPNGIFTIMIWNAESDNTPNSSLLPPGVYVADLVRVMTDGRIERLWEGDVIVNEGTTR